MAYRFFIQLYPQDGQTYSPVNIEDKFDCLYMKFKDFAFDGEVKNTYSESFIERDGDTVWTPSHADIKFSPYECTLDVLFRKGNVQSKSRAMYDYIRGHILEYHDTFRNRYVQLLCTKQPQIGEEKLYGYTKYQKVSFTFINIRGRSYGSSQLNFEEKIHISLTTDTDGKNVYIKMSRPLATDEYIVLMTRGKTLVRTGEPSGATRPKANHRWIYPNFTKKYDVQSSIAPTKYLDAVTDAKGKRLHYLPEWRVVERLNGKTRLCIRKSNNSTLLVPWRKGATGVCTFGVTVIGLNSNGKSRRISNVCYIKSRVKVIGTGQTESDIASCYIV